MMKWLLAVGVAWLGFDAFVLQPAKNQPRPKAQRVAAVETSWPQLPARKDDKKPHHGYSSVASARGGRSGR